MFSFNTKALLTVSLIGFIALSCGEKSGPVILLNSFTSGTGVVSGSATADPFLDPNVQDVVILVNNVVATQDVLDASGNVIIPAGSALDENGDGNPDTLPFPDTCTTALAPGCGFPPSSASFDIDGVPLNLSYTLTMLFRSSTGQTLYSGTTDLFNNTDLLETLAITINKLT